MKLEDEIDDAKEKVNNINSDKLRGITHKDP
jgi:hypothetical protein